MGLALNTIIFIIAALIGYLLQELGLFHKIVISRDVIPKMTITGVRFKGPYKDTGKPFIELENKLNEAKIDVKYVGLYYDDVQKVPADQLRTFIGAIVKNPNEETIKKLKELDLEVFEVEEMDGLHAYYPISKMSFLEGMCFMTAPMKVYPAMAKYLESNPDIKNSGFDDYDGKNIPCFEVYDRNTKQIHFMFPNNKSKEILTDFK
ncbi:hypothetical protein BCR32DRAFT_290801 [Anaeromyces robustus]|uniref:GyrI-like small molecule binding domain-containing protein n=1 Tax=Anaeromyces robustus TaxID=1754192 RepID=A0A1Y1XIR4_9FUNG|nr:hypothetical protein BCR32DRAFT_290801 [Anaeromyces robustus]|eukprot:ORX85244.1 hypothetical protein BCR32DRAFT_290801 [Anaeromyces robustus]